MNNLEDIIDPDLDEKKFLESDYDEQRSILDNLEMEKITIGNEISILRGKIESLSSGNFFKKILNKSERDKLLLEKEEKRNLYNHYLQKSSKLYNLLIEASEHPKDDGNNSNKLTEPEINFSFEEEKNEKTDLNFSKTEVNKENIKKYFSEEYLTSLSLDQYINLLQRFPGEMVSNAIRQGVRDHAEFYYHTVGLAEFSNQFKINLKNGRLNSLIGDSVKNDGKNGAMMVFLERNIKLSELNNEQEALDALNKSILASKNDPSTMNHYEDKLAIHFAVQEVADRNYGGEKNNEIFMVFPSLHIASQYYFSQIPLTEGSYGAASDLWVWDKKLEGINLNSGVAFIPANQQVDQQTGSKYELDQNDKPIENQNYIDQTLNFINSVEFVDIAKKAIQIRNGLGYTYINYNDLYDGKTYKFENRKEKNIFLNERLKNLYSEISQKFNIDDPALQEVVFNHHFLEKQLNINSTDYSNKEEDVKNLLLKNELLFKKSTQPISSKEYWTKYFVDNPDQKLTKIVFYEESTPSEALQSWQTKNNFNLNPKDDQYLGFGENAREHPTEIAENNIDQFQISAQKAIKEYFKQKTVRL